ncbi:MAG: hypothetical protein ACK4ZJ_16595, partial [Allorhizobium sp.]
APARAGGGMLSSEAACETPAASGRVAAGASVTGDIGGTPRSGAGGALGAGGDVITVGPRPPGTVPSAENWRTKSSQAGGAALAANATAGGRAGDVRLCSAGSRGTVGLAWSPASEAGCDCCGCCCCCCCCCMCISVMEDSIGVTDVVPPVGLGPTGSDAAGGALPITGVSKNPRCSDRSTLS